jgi:predicted RNase H-like HicB family nuclease
MTLLEYPARIYNERDGLISVVFIDLELATQGEGWDDAMAMARDALEGRLYCHVLDGEPIPQPSAVGNHFPEDSDGIVAVAIDLDKITDDVRADYEAKIERTYKLAAQFSARII